MTRQTFFERRGPISVGELAKLADARLGQASQAARLISDVAPVTDCGPQDVTYAIDRRRSELVKRATPGACFIAAEFADWLPSETVALVTPLPEAAFAFAVAAFYPDAMRRGHRTGNRGAGSINESARLGSGVEIESGAVIGANVEIGDGTFVGANTVVCAGVRIGRQCMIGPGVSIMHALIGDNVMVHPGARIGQDGFGYAMTPDGFCKLPQIGRVVIHDHAEIGANATIDRGALADTIVGEGTKIDNLCQIAHNVRVGRSCAFAAQVGVSGSAKIGDGVVAGGKVGIAPHVTIGDGAQLTGGSKVFHSVRPGVRVFGFPSKPIDQYFRELRAVARLGRGAETAKGGE